MFMHITHGVHMHTLHIMSTLILMCMLEYTNAHIAAAKAIQQSFILTRYIAKKNVWVPLDANPRGPKRKWVPKSPPFVFDVGAGSHTTQESWCLGGGCNGFMDITHLMHRYQGSFGGTTTMFWRIRVQFMCWLLAQRLSTLVLMMINLCSYVY